MSVCLLGCCRRSGRGAHCIGRAWRSHHHRCIGGQSLLIDLQALILAERVCRHCPWYSSTSEPLASMDEHNNTTALDHSSPLTRRAQVCHSLPSSPTATARVASTLPPSQTHPRLSHSVTERADSCQSNSEAPCGNSRSKVTRFALPPRLGGRTLLSCKNVPKYSKNG